jgi:RsiW-degrading membrane proteinase PrsW (M82 family)
MFVRRVVYNNGIRVTQHRRKNNIFSDFYISHFASHKLYIWWNSMKTKRFVQWNKTYSVIIFLIRAWHMQLVEGTTTDFCNSFG